MVDTLFPANAVSGAPNYSGRQLRQTNAASLPMGDPARPLGGLSGVRSGTSTTTVTATSTTWTCKPFAGSADVMTASESGPYEFAFDANATGSVNAADASNPRVDIVYVQITDPEDGATAPVATRGYLAGSAAVSPVPPATPARSFVIAQINVPKAGGGSPTVTWVASGVTPGNIQFQTKARLDAWTTAPSGTEATVLADPSVGLNGKYVSGTSGWDAVGPAVVVAPAAVLFGSVPPANTHLFTQSGVATVTTVASGDANIPYPKAFPNGVVSAHVQRVDFATYGLTVEVLNSTQSLSQLNFRVYTGGSTVLPSSGGIKYAYTVTGW